jgi:glc operon protein GlcG
MQSGSYLGQIEALQIINAAVRIVEEQRLAAVAVAVADVDGNIIASLLMDGCKLPSMVIARKKAYTAARWRTATLEFRFTMDPVSTKWVPSDDAWNQADLLAGAQSEPDFMFWGGGVPVYFYGELVGAIGISGLSEAEDHQLANRVYLSVPSLNPA